VSLAHGVIRAVCFCGTFLKVALTGRYPASCSMEFGLSSDSCVSAIACLPQPVVKSNTSSIIRPEAWGSGSPSCKGILERIFGGTPNPSRGLRPLHSCSLLNRYIAIKAKTGYNDGGVNYKKHV